MRQKCNNIPALVAAIQAKCPDLTAEIIVNHEAWYKVYLSLREKQRLSIREWRKQREIEKTKKNCENKILEETPKEKTSSTLTKELSNRMADKCKGKITNTDFVEINNADQKKQLIRQWKEEKENKRLMDEEQSRFLMESKLVAQEKRKRERLKRIQEALTEYRERKSMEVSSKTSKDVSKAPVKYNPMLIKAFR